MKTDGVRCNNPKIELGVGSIMDTKST